MSTTGGMTPDIVLRASDDWKRWGTGPKQAGDVLVGSALDRATDHLPILSRMGFKSYGEARLYTVPV